MDNISKNHRDQSNKFVDMASPKKEIKLGFLPSSTSPQPPIERLKSIDFRTARVNVDLEEFEHGSPNDFIVNTRDKDPSAEKTIPYDMNPRLNLAQNIIQDSRQSDSNLDFDQNIGSVRLSIFKKEEPYGDDEAPSFSNHGFENNMLKK